MVDRPEIARARHLAAAARREAFTALTEKLEAVEKKWVSHQRTLESLQQGENENEGPVADALRDRLRILERILNKARRATSEAREVVSAYRDTSLPTVAQRAAEVAKHWDDVERSSPSSGLAVVQMIHRRETVARSARAVVSAHEEVVDGLRKALYLPKLRLQHCTFDAKRLSAA